MSLAAILGYALEGYTKAIKEHEEKIQKEEEKQFDREIKQFNFQRARKLDKRGDQEYEYKVKKREKMDPLEYQGKKLGLQLKQEQLKGLPLDRRLKGLSIADKEEQLANRPTQRKREGERFEMFKKNFGVSYDTALLDYAKKKNALDSSKIKLKEEKIQKAFDNIARSIINNDMNAAVRGYNNYMKSSGNLSPENEAVEAVLDGKGKDAILVVKTKDGKEHTFTMDFITQLRQAGRPSKMKRYTTVKSTDEGILDQLSGKVTRFKNKAGSTGKVTNKTKFLMEMQKEIQKKTGKKLPLYKVNSFIRGDDKKTIVSIAKSLQKNDFNLFGEKKKDIKDYIKDAEKVHKELLKKYGDPKYLIDGKKGEKFETGYKKDEAYYRKNAKALSKKTGKDLTFVRLDRDHAVYKATVNGEETLIKVKRQ